MTSQTTLLSDPATGVLFATEAIAYTYDEYMNPLVAASNRTDAYGWHAVTTLKEFTQVCVGGGGGMLGGSNRAAAPKSPSPPPSLQNLDPAVWILGLVANQTGVAVDSGPLTSLPRTVLRAYDLATGRVVNETSMAGYPAAEVRRGSPAPPRTQHAPNPSRPLPAPRRRR